MSTEVVSCYIYSDNKSLPPILLPDGEAVFVGRQPETEITDTRVSRKQVRLFASYSDLKVFVQQLGSRPCSLNGFKTERNAKIVAQHGDRLEILYGSYPYTIEFNPPPTRRKKRTNPEMSHAPNDEEDFQVSKKIKTDGNVVDETTSEQSLAVPGCSKDSNGQTKNFNIFDYNKKTDKRGSWKELGNGSVFMYKSEGLEGRNKIAAYDMDGTLIKTISGLVFPKDYKDWQLAYPEVPAKLKKMYDDGYKIVIMSNQGRLGRLGKVTVNNFKTKIENIVHKIGVPMQVFLANGRNIYRKPCTGMWDLLVNEYNDGIEVIKEQSFYVGDAAGRPAEGKRKKDHSSADRLLAMNLGLQFFTPEEHFLGLKPTKFTDPLFDPKVANRNSNLLDPPDAVISSKSQEVIIMVGSPGSGKSHFAKNYLKNYHYINRDSLGSWQKCVAALEDALIAMKSVVIDNTNPDVVSRKRYLQVAASYKVPVRCFVMAADIEHVKHNNKFRSLTDPSHDKISDVIINSYAKYYVAPNESEGFTQIVRIHFVPKFKSEEDRKLYEMYLLEN